MRAHVCKLIHGYPQRDVRPFHVPPSLVNQLKSRGRGASMPYERAPVTLKNLSRICHDHGISAGGKEGAQSSCFSSRMTSWSPNCFRAHSPTRATRRPAPIPVRKGCAISRATGRTPFSLTFACQRSNGIEVLRAIRLTDLALPVILITGYANPGELAEARQLGVTDVIAKSYVLTRFTDVLVRIAGTSGPA